MVHIRMVFLSKVSTDLGLVGVAIQVTNFLLLQNYPTVPISYGLAFPRLGLLFLNMRQWVSAIEGKRVGSEFETCAAFFVCVWSVPIVFSLCLDFTWTT
mmetsp:Transcript_60114/g.125787  ORF Transcript_60114/g.125787 Transcript_60114/m.125787 type:complete len:99 (-) Transcript_60114:221-517(-)